MFLIATVLTALATYALVRRVTADDARRGVAGGTALCVVAGARRAQHRALQPGRGRAAARPFCCASSTPIARVGSAMPRWSACAWPGPRFCDVYYAIYCLMIAVGYVGLRVVRVTRAEQPATPVRGDGCSTC